jgi:hypothetical protein
MADHLPMTSLPFRNNSPIVLNYSDFNQFAYQTQDASVTDRFLNHLDEQIPDNRVKVSGNIRFQNCSDRSRANHASDLNQRILCTAPRAESIGTFKKILLKDCVEQIHPRLLRDLILQRGNRYRPLPPILFGI